MRLPYLPTNDVYCSSKLPFLYALASTKEGEKFAKNSAKNGIKRVSDAKKIFTIRISQDILCNFMFSNKKAI